MKTDQITNTFETFTPDGLELVVNTTTGIAFASISAAARMLGKLKQRVSEMVNNPVLNISTTEAQIPTASGLKTVRLIDAVTLYDMATDYNPELARQMGRVGANLYLLNQAGYKVTIKEEAPAQPELPITKLGWMKLAVETEERAIAAEQVAKQLADQIEADSAATAHGNAVSHASNCRDVGSFGKSLATPIGRTKMFTLLRELGFIMANSAIPYQKHIENGNLLVIQVVTELSYGKTRTDSKTLITGKGELAIVKAMEKLDRKEIVTCQMEKEVAMVD